MTSRAGPGSAKPARGEPVLKRRPSQRWEVRRDGVGVNAVEIEEAVSELASRPFDPPEFPFAFLQAFGNKETTIRRLRARSGNASDVPGGVLQRSNIHLAVCESGGVADTVRLLRQSPKTAASKAKFVLATDGIIVEAEDLTADEVISCEFSRLGDHFGFFLPLAGISTVRQIKNNPIDVKATGRLNRLYIELLKDNPEWGTLERRHDLNQFMARLIFCFFAEDTGIFLGQHLFTETVRQMSDPSAGNTHEVISTLFRTMDTRIENRPKAGIRPWADAFPYVNGNLFAGSTECPTFSRIARSYLLRAGELSWRDINPDIFGSMIQAVADDEERGALGMHYTSVPNILKVLNPLFLDDLRATLEAAGDSVRKLRALRRRISAIRIFDPACGSGNFLVIAYKEMRAIEATIVRRTGDDPKSVIPLTNFYGIEIKDFATEVARLALLIAEFQCDVRFIDQVTARSLVLPLKPTGQIRTGNALRVDWLEICPPAQRSLFEEHDLGGPTGRLALEENGLDGAVEVETYICTNPPYYGGKKQSSSQKSDMKDCLSQLLTGKSFKNLDYVCAFIVKAAQYLDIANKAAIVTTNSVSQGAHVPTLWPLVYSFGCELEFAYEPFKWANSAKKNAGVACVIIGVRKANDRPKYIYAEETKRQVPNISPYLVEGQNTIVEPRSQSLSGLSAMITGNAAYDAGHLFLESTEAAEAVLKYPELAKNVRRVTGTSEFIDGVSRYCFWFEDWEKEFAENHPASSDRVKKVQTYRRTGGEVAATLVDKPHQFRYRNGCKHAQIIIPQVSSERRQYLPVGILEPDYVITHLAHAIYDPTLVDFSILSSKLHLTWVTTVCGRLESRLRYASNYRWNTFPVPFLTDANRAELTRRAEDILLAREAHFPATIADLYDPVAMPDDLRRAHEANDEALERIYIGRRFRNDTERLEKLFSMYVQMTKNDLKSKSPRKTKAFRKSAA